MQNECLMSCGRHFPSLIAAATSLVPRPLPHLFLLLSLGMLLKCVSGRGRVSGYTGLTSCRCGVVIAFVSNPNEINTDRPQLQPQSTRTATATSTSLFLLAFYLHSLRRIKLLCTNQIHKHKIPRHTHSLGRQQKHNKYTHKHIEAPLASNCHA